MTCLSSEVTKQLIDMFLSFKVCYLHGQILTFSSFLCLCIGKFVVIVVIFITIVVVVVIIIIIIIIEFSSFFFSWYCLPINPGLPRQ